MQNLAINNKFVTINDPNLKWTTICGAIPFMQFSVNNKPSRFSLLSSAMMMFGSRFHDIPDLYFAINKIHNDMAIGYKSMKDRDYNYLYQLQLHLKKMRIQLKKKWAKYCLTSKKQYDRRYNLAPTRDKNGKLQPPKHAFGYQSLNSFRKGVKVLYYVGPHRGINGKWRQRWTGPWLLAKQSGQYRVTILDTESGKTYDVSIDRLKLFKENDKNMYLNQYEYEDLLEKMKRDKPSESDEDQ